MPTEINPVLYDPPVSPNSVDTPQGDGVWAEIDKVWANIDTAISSDQLLYTLIGLLAVLLAISLRSRRKRAKAETEGHRSELTTTDRAVTRITGILATAMVATGAWKVFGDVLHLHPLVRVALFFFAEAQIVSAWRRVRRHIYRHAALGHGIWTIYGIAFGSAGIAALDADNTVEVAIRLFAAGVAAYMIAEELAEELDIYLTAHPDRRPTGKPRGRINWVHNLESVLVLLRLAQATDRTLEEVERQRRIARFARTAHRLHILQEDGAARWRVRLVRRRLRRLTESANEHLKLATDHVALSEVRAQLALLYGVEDGTSRFAVADIRPLKPREQLAISDRPFEAPPDPQDSHPDLQERSQPTATEIAESLAQRLSRDVHRARPAVRTRVLRWVGSAKPAEHPAANPAEKQTESALEKPEAKAPANTEAKPARPPRVPTQTLADEVPDSVRKLSAAFARKPGGTNAELARLARVSIGSANRHLPKIRAAANGRENNSDSQERSQVVPILPLIENPRPLVKQGVNGTTNPLTEEHR